MKKLKLLMIIVTTFSGCSKNDLNQPEIVIDAYIDAMVLDSDGNDYLADASNRQFAVIDSATRKSADFGPDGTSYLVIPPEGENNIYLIRFFFNPDLSSSNLYIRWNEDLNDTLTGLIERSNGSAFLREVLYNSELLWKAGTSESGRIITILNPSKVNH